MRVFISYRHEDAKAAARLIFERLRERFGENNVFLDIDIPPARDFRAHIAEYLSLSSVVVAVIGRTWTRDGAILDNRDFVRMEIEAALALGVPIVPVFVDGARPPHTSTVPLSLVPVLGLQGLPVDTGRDFDSNMREVIRVLEQGRGSRAGASRRASYRKYAASTLAFIAGWAALVTMFWFLFVSAGKTMDKRRLDGAVLFSGIVAASVTTGVWFWRTRKREGHR